MSPLLKTIALRPIHYTMKAASALIPIPIPQLVSGPGSVNRIPELVRSARVNRLLVVTDQGLSKIGLTDKVTKPLAEENIFYTVFDGVQPNPSIQNVEDGLNIYLNNHCNGIIAFGGGSPMDCAKMIGARAVKRKKPVEKMRGKFKIMKALPPLFAIPTTAGTGSEATAAAVVSNPATHEKFAVIDFKLVPAVAVLDPELMIELPPHITSSTGMDALTHAVEAYIGLHDTKFTREKSEKATKIILQTLEDVYKDGSDLEKRNQLTLASYYGGLAFTRTFVGYVHAIAHNLGGLYGVPHGLANAIVLPYVLEASRKQAENKLAKLALISGLGKETDAKEDLSNKFIEKIREMNRNMNIPTSIKELKEEDVPLIVQRALSEANLDYPVPRIMNKKELTELVRSLLP